MNSPVPKFNFIFWKILFVRVLLCLFLLGFFMKSEAQKTPVFKGFLVEQNSDTIFCEIKIKQFPCSTVKIKVDNSAQGFQNFSLENIQKISNGKEIEYLVFPIIEEERTESVLVKKVVAGKINLYKGKSSRGNLIYFLNSASIPRTVQIHPKGVNSFLKNYFKNCPRLSARIHYKYSEILDALLYYNDCLFPTIPLQVLEEPQKGLTIGLGYRGFYYRTSPEFSGEGYFNSGNFSASPSGGGGVFLKSYLTSNWSFQLGANYLRYQILTDELVNPLGQSSLVKFNLKIIEMPFEVFYQFDVPLQPHISVGFGVDFLVKPTVEETPFKARNEPTRVNFKKENYGLHLGVGVSKKWNKNSELIFRLKYVRESIRVKTFHFEPQRLNYVSSETKLNPHRVEVSAAYVFLMKE